MEKVIYLDHHATTPLDPAVLESMMPYLTSSFANASSVVHSMGRQAAQAVTRAREQVGTLIGAEDPEGEITFTSGSTEAINTVLKGVFEQYQSLGKHIITCRTEHKAVLDTLHYLERKGAIISYLEVDESGQIDPKELEASIQPDTVLITLMSANNETGVCHDMEEIAQIAERHDVLLFCDATASAGTLPLDLRQTPIDILCLSAHKLYGPKGVGALYVRKKNKRIQVQPLLHGGGHEQGRRAGTLNVPAIVGFGQAAELCSKSINDGYEAKKLGALRDQLEQGLLQIPQTYVNGRDAKRVPSTTNITFRHLRASTLMTRLPHICMSTGAACVTGSREPSHVLLAMGLSPDDAHGSIRLSLGRFNTEDEVKKVVQDLQDMVQSLRRESPVWQLFEKGLIP